MSGEIIKSGIRGVWKALISENLEEALSFYTDDATLTWGQFSFKGIEEIRRWAKELAQHLGKLAFRENELTIEGDKAIQNFTIMFAPPDTFRGIMSGVGLYEFKNGKIQYLKITFFPGYTVVNKEYFELCFTKYELTRSESSSSKAD
ncbi:MAG: Nuclear transport factor 2 family protein [Thermoproteota archaeon]|nr:Nuclear transport factor 2 family protein [Thermoproteota archaeon]